MADSHHTQNDCDVLVVGAGPTGLIAANLLKRSGVAVRIVDERAEASRESRAFAIQARTMELFQHLGVVDKLLDRGVINPVIEFYVGGKHAGGLNYDLAGSPDTSYPFIFLLPQSQTEAILIEDLSAHGVEVEREVKITGLEQDANGVVARGTAAGGAAANIRSAYTIGADGARSIVRTALGLSFEGSKYPQTFLLADCRVEWPRDHDPFDHARFRVFLNGSSIGLFLPLDGAACSRVMATDHSGKADQSGPAATQMDLAEIQTAFSLAAGMDVTLSDPVWTTRYRVHHRGVDTYSKGRVFLAGDAAHIHSPAGGQGMNTGLQDAANLAWKLAAVLRGADRGLLDSYDAERRPVGQQVVATSDKMFSAAAGKTGWEATVRDWIAKPAAAAISNMKSVQHKAFRTLSELDIAYSPDFGDDAAPALGKAGPQIGQRAPNATIARHTDVFDLTAGYGFTVLALSRKPLERDEAGRAADALDTLKQGKQGGVTTHLVTRLAVGRDPRAVFVSSAEVFEAYGLRDQDAQATYLVRPDGYIAWRGDGLDAAGCGRFLAQFGFADAA
ncbi:MAG: FAD-dependent monooxygenase [Gemmatimonadaceae bacterium]|nr:FAD-dependent monooxygenase [Acetobacteraceae bacterium]